MSSVRPLAIVLAALLLAPAFATVALAANWQPDGGDWATYRGSRSHTAATPSPSAFSGSALDIHVKWERTDDPGYWIPPVAADLDGDGVAEVVAVVGNASADPTNLQNPVSVSSGLNTINGATGALRWAKAPETGYLDFFSPALGDIDNDGRGEIVYFHGQPLTGSSLTNKVVALEADGTQKWTYSDTNWGSRVPLPLTAMNIGNVDGESTQQEVVFTLLLATVTTTIQGGKVVIAGTNPEYRVIALNGEGSSASASWTRTFTGKGSGSNVALGDLNGDGTLDAVFGSGARSGTLIETDSARITISSDFEDNKVKAYYGGGNPPVAFDFAATGFFPGELGTAPVIADLDGDGTPEVVQPLWVRNFPPQATDTSTVLVLNHDGTERWRTTVNAAIGALIAQAPPAVADLDGDGRKDIVLQTSNGAASDRYRMIALKPDGTVLWRGPDLGREMTGLPAVGDITGDGKPEVLGMYGSGIANAEVQTLVVFNGQTGAELFRKSFAVGPSVGGPLLVDLDGDDDGRLEILVNTGFWGEPGKLIALEPELPDLRLTALALSGAEHLHGVPETVSATVANIGSRALANAVVRFTENGTTVAQQVINLSAGASQVVSFPWTPLTLGARGLRLEGDPDKAKPEWAENNNAQETTVTVRAPELRFGTTDPVLSDPTPGSGDTIQVGVTLTNAGGKDAANVLVRFLQDDAVFAEQTVAALAKGASTTLTKSLLVVGDQDRTIRVLADPEDAIVEEDETNNVVARFLNVVAPDFTVGNIGFSDDHPGVGDTIQVSATVSNVGLKNGANVVVRFLDEDAAFGESTVASLAQGASTTLTKALLVDGEFDHTIRVVADPDGLIVEENELNNTATRLLDVVFTAPDLVPGALGLSDPTPGEDETIQVSVTVTNSGSKDAAGFVVRFLDDDAAFGEVPVATLAEGASTVVSRDLLVQGAHDHTLRVVVDPDREVNEEDEANNEVTALLHVLVPDLVLGPADLHASDPNPDEFDTLTVTATVHNDAPGGKVPTDVLVQLLDGGAVVASQVVPGIPAGSSRSVALDYTISGLGPRSLTVQVDPEGAIQELSDGNNQAALGVVVGKIAVTVTMAKSAYAFQEQAEGVATLRFRNTGLPVADQEFRLPVEYIIGTSTGTPADQLVALVGAAVARLAGTSDQHLQLCSLARCVLLTADLEASLQQLLGSGASGGGQGGELRLRLFTLDVRTNLLGEASFAVPYSLFQTLDGFEGLAGLEVCLAGFPEVTDVLAGLPQPVPPCATQVGSWPGMPGVANLPGRYRASAVTDWYGFTFRGSADWIYV